MRPDHCILIAKSSYCHCIFIILLSYCYYTGDDTCGLITRCHRLVDTLQILLGGHQVFLIEFVLWNQTCIFSTINNRFIFPGVSPQVGKNVLLLFFKSKQKSGKAKHSLESSQHCLLLQLKDDHEGCPIRRSLFLAPGAPSLSFLNDQHRPWMLARIFFFCQNKSSFCRAPLLWAGLWLLL